MKRIATAAVCSLIGVVLTTSSGCTKDDESSKVTRKDDTKTSEPTGPSQAEEPPPTDPVKMLQDCWAAFSAWDKETFRRCYADETDVMTIDSVPPEAPVKTSRDVMVKIGTFRNAFPDFKAQPMLVLVSGRKAHVLGLLSGTHKGRSMGLPPTNKRMSILYAQIHELDEQGRMRTQRDYTDQATLLSQLGLQENPVAPKEEQSWPQPITVVAKGDDREGQNLAAIKSLLDALARTKVEDVLAHYAPDATLRFVFLADTYAGKKLIEDTTKTYFTQHRDLKLDVRDVWAAGDWVVAETTAKGTLAQDLGGLATKGKPWEQSSLDVYKLEGGKITQQFAFSNSLKFSSDVGLIDPEALGGEPAE